MSETAKYPIGRRHAAGAAFERCRDAVSEPRVRIERGTEWRVRNEKGHLAAADFVPPERENGAGEGI